MVTHAKRVAVSPDGERVAFFKTGTTVIMASYPTAHIEKTIVNNFDEILSPPLLLWCGNDLPILISSLSIFPLHKLTSAKKPHLYCVAEIDGLRVLSDTGSHLISRVSEEL